MNEQGFVEGLQVDELCGISTVEERQVALGETRLATMRNRE
jgi:hypothetical protein